MTWSTIEGCAMTMALAVALHCGEWRLGAMLAALLVMQGARAFVLVPASRVDIFVQAGAWPAVLAAGAWSAMHASRGAIAQVALPFITYGIALALYGRLLAPWWPAPLMASQVAAGAVAVALWARARGRRGPRLTLAQAAALLLPLSSLVDAVTVFAGAPSPVRAVLGVATYAAVGGMVAACRSAG